MVLIANPGARNSLRHAEIAHRTLRAAGRAVEIVVSEAPGHAVELAAEAWAGDAIAVAVGGDGTIGEVVRGLLRAGTGAPLGIVPAGTGNDSAKCLGVPLDPVASSTALLDPLESPLDLAEVNDRAFMGIAVLGFAADVGRTVNRWKSARRWAPLRPLGPRLYPLASLYHLGRRPRPLRAVIRVDEDEPLEAELFTAFFANQPGVGGVFLPCPAASPRDGLLDVGVIAARHEGRRLSLSQQVQTLRGAMTGAHVALPWVRASRAAHGVALEVDREVVLLADGDELPPARHFRLRPLPGAVRLLVPRREEDRAPGGTGYSRECPNCGDC